MTTYAIIYALLIAACLYYICPMRLRWLVLLFFSYAIYAQGGRQAVAFILMTTITTWAGALFIGRIGERSKAAIKAQKATLDAAAKKALKHRARTRQRILFWLTLLLNFGVLALLKYFPGAPNGILSLIFGAAGRTAPTIKLFVPLGISFYTFQWMGYLIDVYNGK